MLLHIRFIILSCAHIQPSSIPRLVPIFPKPKTVSMQKDDLKLLYEWANTYGKCVRQRTVRQETTSYKCRTLPLNMYVSTSIEGTEVTFNHINEYDERESENETEETSSSQLSHVLVGNDDHESSAELSFLNTRNSSRSGRTYTLLHDCWTTYDLSLSVI